MSFVESWIDQGKAPSLNAVLAAIDQGGIGAVNIYMGGRDAYLGGPPANGWTPQFVAEITAARPSVAFFGSWVSLIPGQGSYNLGFSDGLDAIQAALNYPMVRLLSYDVEPGAFDANPGGVADAMRGFTDAAHSKSFLSMPYSVPRGLAAGSQNADAIWIANPNPGGDDPANQPLDPAFFAGRRSVQCCLLIAAGVDWDLSHSQFSIGGGDLTPDEHQTLSDINVRTAELYNYLRYGADSAGNHEFDADRLAELTALVKNLQVPPANLQPVLNAIAALKAELDTVKIKTDKDLA